MGPRKQLCPPDIISWVNQQPANGQQQQLSKGMIPHINSIREVFHHWVQSMRLMEPNIAVFLL